jgi:glycerol-3-phosphate dehydrogenase (NAD+)
MWVYEEKLDAATLPASHDHLQGALLSETINKTHENVKYLPGITLPTNIIAVPDLATAAAGATCLVFVVPHQFLPKLLPTLASALASDGPGGKKTGEERIRSGAVRAISLIKGIDFDAHGLVLISDTIRDGLFGVDTAVLMGANVANEVACGQFCEATIGCTHAGNAKLWKDIFQTDTFRIETTDDSATVELCGALKNVVALGAGFVDGLNMGSNTKAAILRIGLLEMRQFCRQFYGKTHPSHAVPANTGLDHVGRANVRDETFFESCAVADLITTSYAGRNRKVAEAFVRTGRYPSVLPRYNTFYLSVCVCCAGRTWEELEMELLHGQKLQGTLTAVEVHRVLERHGCSAEYPLFTAIYRVMTKEVPPADLVKLYLPAHIPHPAKEDA